jgi:hypothetical protein
MKKGGLVLANCTLITVESRHIMSIDRATDERTAGRNVELLEGMMSGTGGVVLNNQDRAMALVFSTYMFKHQGCTISQ